MSWSSPCAPSLAGPTVGPPSSCSAQAKKEWFAALPEPCPTASPRTTPSAASSRGSTPPSFQAASSAGSRPSARGDLGGRHVAIDGKTLRRLAATGPRASRLLHLVSAWAAANRLTWARSPSTRSPTRSRPSPSCCRCCDLDGAMVTIDAMGCQKEIARQIRGRGGRLRAGGQGEPADAVRRHQGLLRAGDGERFRRGAPMRSRGGGGEGAWADRRACLHGDLRAARAGHGRGVRWT